MLKVQLCAGQSGYPSKKTIQKIFKASVNQESRKRVQIGRNAWTACNLDSAFFTRDTIVFVNTESMTCCAKVQWTFYRKNAFVQNLAQTCKEPSSATATKLKDFYSVDFIEKNSLIIMLTRNREGKEISFRVMSADRENKTIKLLRIRM